MSKKILILLALFFFFASLFGALFWWETGLRPVDHQSKEQINFVVSKGETIAKITARLKEENLIRDPFRFKLYILLKGVAKKIQVGNFPLSGSLTVPEIVRVLSSAVKGRRVTIIEGLRQEQIEEFLAEKGFPLVAREWRQEIVGQKLEGKLFPDTYFFSPEASQASILRIINRNFQKKVVEGLSGEISRSKLTFDQILVSASIVERESRNETDRRLVAGILLKRWQKGWPLQADATVQYAVANKKCGRAVRSEKCDWWPKKLTEKDLEINSPYNTYKYRGLPPGPICSPGLSSIKAVLNPIDSPYWYYLNDSEGVMHYAKTDEEQAKNIQKYLR